MASKALIVCALLTTCYVGPCAREKEEVMFLGSACLKMPGRDLPSCA